MLLLLLACTPTAPVASDPPALLTCPALLDGGAPATDETELRTLLAAVQDNLFPELEGVEITMAPNQSEDGFFSANPDLTTLSAPPLERRYVVAYSTVQFEAPPPRDAVTAILAHELKHVLDYTEMDTQELVDFGIWYLQGDIAAYERQTDEHALELGCGEGLILYREWLYDRVTPEVEAQKRIDYYTPEEIGSWIEEHG